MLMTLKFVLQLQPEFWLYILTASTVFPLEHTLGISTEYDQNKTLDTMPPSK